MNKQQRKTIKLKLTGDIPLNEYEKEELLELLNEQDFFDDLAATIAENQIELSPEDIENNFKCVLDSIKEEE